MFGAGQQPDPLSVLGLGPQARWPEVRQSYIARLHLYHPQHQPQDFMRVVDAYDTLKRFFRASNPHAAEAGESDGENCSSGPSKRRRADAAGASIASPCATLPTFAGLQLVAPAPVIALDPRGIGHIGTPGGPLAFGAHPSVAPQSAAASQSSFGHGLSSSIDMAMDAFGGDDEGGLARTVSNHMGTVNGGALFGGMQGAPLSMRFPGQPGNGGCGIRPSPFFSDTGGSSMMIG